MLQFLRNFGCVTQHAEFCPTCGHYVVVTYFENEYHGWSWNPATNIENSFTPEMVI